MSSTVRWGILGCGRIAHKFASDLKYVSGAALVAAASRSREKADAFAHDFEVPRVYNRYEQLAEDPGVDVIYIASPHTMHYEHTLLCLDHGKAVLCEKPFAMNRRQAGAMIERARQKKRFLMEALWTKFTPHYQKMQEMVRAGKLGNIRSVLVNFGFAPDPPVPQRLFDPALGGGTLLDIGIYNIFLALSVLGQPDAIEASMTPADTGIDAQCAILFKYRNGALAQLFSTFCSNLATEADINGDRGRLRLTSRFYEPGTTLEYYPGRVDSRQEIPYDREPGWGYQHEARHVTECLQKGWTESPVMSANDTLQLMDILDEVRRIAGIQYAADAL